MNNRNNDKKKNQPEQPRGKNKDNVRKPALRKCVTCRGTGRSNGKVCIACGGVGGVDLGTI